MVEVTAAANLFVTASTTQAVSELEKLRLTGAYTWSSIGKMAEVAAIGIAAAAGSIWIATAAVNDWQKSMVNAQAIGGLTTDQMWELADASLEAGKQMGIASSEIAEGYLELTRAGFSDMNEIMAMNNVIMRAAVANQIAYGEAAEVTIKSLNAFGIGVEQAEEHVGILQYIANQTLADFSTFSDVMRYAGSTSAFAGVQFEELASAMGVLTDIAMEAGIGARGMNQMLLDMIKNADEFAAFAQRMGVEVEVFTEEGTLNLSEIIMKFGELGLTMEVLQESAQEFNVRALRSWLGLISNADRYRELLEGTGDAADYFNRTYLAQLETIDTVLGMIREEFLAIFRNKEVVDMLTNFFFQLRAWVREEGAERIGGILNILMEMFVVNFPIIMDLMDGLLRIMQDMGPAFMDTLLALNMLLSGGLGPMMIMMMLINPMIENMMYNIKIAPILLETLTKKININTWQWENLNFALTATAIIMKSIVQGIFGMMFAFSMFDSAASSSGRWLAVLMGIVTALNVAVGIGTVLWSMYKAAMISGPAAIAVGAIVTGAVVAAGYYLSQTMRAEQEARMEAQREAAAGQHEAWLSEMGVESAQTGMWDTGLRTKLVRVHPREMILPPGPAEAYRQGVGGGTVVNINISEGAYVAEDVVQMIEQTVARQFKSSLRGIIY